MLECVLANDFVELVILLLAFAMFCVVGLGTLWTIGFKVLDAIYGKVK